MQKKIKDGKVAVLYSPDFGAGWYSWHHIEELLYDPVVVDMVLDKTTAETIELYCDSVYSNTAFYGGARDLEVIWIPQGTQFIINEYDGNEILTTKDEIQWMVA